MAQVYCSDPSHAVLTQHSRCVPGELSPPTARRPTVVIGALILYGSGVFEAHAILSGRQKEKRCSAIDFGSCPYSAVGVAGACHKRASGRARRWCSNACRMKNYRARHPKHRSDR